MPATNTSSSSENPRDGISRFHMRGEPGRSTRPGRPLSLLTIVVIGLRRADRDLRLELQEVFLPDAADVHQLLDLLERSVLLAVLDDPRGGFRADAGQRFEIDRRGRVEVDGGAGGRLRGGS